MQFVLQNTQFERRTEQGIITLVSGNTNSLIRGPLGSPSPPTFPTLGHATISSGEWRTLYHQIDRVVAVMCLWLDTSFLKRWRSRTAKPPSGPCRRLNQPTTPIDRPSLLVCLQAVRNPPQDLSDLPKPAISLQSAGTISPRIRSRWRSCRVLAEYTGPHSWGRTVASWLPR